MKPIQFIFGTFNDQPSGTSTSEIEKAYQKAYKPFLSLLNTFSDIPVVLHYSGSLLEWMEENHPEFIMLLGEMVKRKQVELLGGGYYEPILTLIPDSDKLGQIEKLTTYIRATFGTRPRGCWITERIWEPGLAKILKNSGMDFTFLDDYYFHIAGVEKDNCYLPYLTEDQGKLITVFPISISLKNQVPYHKPKAVLDSLINISDGSGQRVVVLMIEGEKLGNWENTYELCYNKNWLNNFLKLLKENREWIKPITSRSYLKQIPAQSRIYFPCLAHREMMEWVLTTERQKSYKECSVKLQSILDAGLYLRGGFFRQFLTKYPEINNLYSRLMYTHILVNQVRGDKYTKKAARNELWKGQTNIVYWHGRTGGLYNSRLRKSVYRSFIEAERLTRGSGSVIPSIIKTDFDMDGHSEYLYQGPKLNVYIHRMGGSIIELDFLPVSWNYLDTMARWPEPYHRRKQDGCDWYPRKGFLDHFFTPNTDIDNFDRMNNFESGDFVDQPFELVELKREQRELILKRTGRLNIRKKAYPFYIEKKYSFKDTSIILDITLINVSNALLDIRYGLEMNLSMASNTDEHVKIMCVKENQKKKLTREKIVVSGISSIRIHDLLNKVLIGLDSENIFSLWSLPVETVSKELYQLIYQSSCFVLRWDFSLKAGDQWNTKVSLNVQEV